MAEDVYIDGAWREGTGGRFEKTDPATGAVSWQGRAASRSEVVSAVTSARVALAEWSRRPQAERVDILRAFAQNITDQRDAIATAISRDMGKTLWESTGEATAMAAKVDLAIKAQAERAGSTSSSAAFGRLQLTHRPHGVMAVFGPFNFPGHLPTGHIIPALLAGNTCVFKPSELAPSVVKILVDAFAGAGLPDGVLNVTQGGRDTGAALMEADINGLLFTGSSRTGLFFHKYFSGRPEIILALEMGGNNPLVVWDPADIESAADIAAQSSFMTTGQRCSCARRVFVPAGRWGDGVVDAIVARAEGLRIGAAHDDNAFMGPLVSRQAALDALDFQAMLIDKGGRCLRALDHIDPESGFVTAGVIDVGAAQAIPDEELFAPLMQIIRVDRFDTAIELANQTRYGLSAGLVSDDDMLWQRACDGIRAGLINRNRPTVGASGTMPFGGPGWSGNSRPGAWYAADYCAWPQASQICDKAVRIKACGFPS